MYIWTDVNLWYIAIQKYFDIVSLLQNTCQCAWHYFCFDGIPDIPDAHSFVDSVLALLWIRGQFNSNVSKVMLIQNDWSINATFKTYHSAPNIGTFLHNTSGIMPHSMLVYWIIHVLIAVLH